MASNETAEINDLTLKASPVGTDELELQETGGGNTRKATIVSLPVTVAQVTGTVPLDQGGTNADLSGTGPGALVQASSGANITVETLDEARGGTGQSSYTKGDLVAATGATTLAKIAVGTDWTFLAADSSQGAGIRYWRGPSVRQFTQATHGLSVLDLLKFTGGTWAKAQADAEANLAIGWAIGVPDANTVQVALLVGEFMTATTHGKGSAGDVVYLSQSVAGGTTTTKPTKDYVQQVAIVADANTLIVGAEPTWELI